MKLHQKLIVTLLILVTANLPILAQTGQALPLNPTTIEKAKPKTVEIAEAPPTNNRELFRSSLIKAAVAANKKGELSRRDLLRIRVASFSPGFISKVEDLAVVQLSSSGMEGPFTVSDEGEIIRETVNWEGLAAFLEKLLPLVLALIKAFGA